MATILSDFNDTPAPRSNILRFDACLSQPAALTDEQIGAMRAPETKALARDAVAARRRDCLCEAEKRLNANRGDSSADRMSGLSEAENAPAGPSSASTRAIQAEKPSETLMREITPPIQSDVERGQGNSVNARLHRLIGGR